MCEIEHCDDAGVTLVEMLVVVVILGILASVVTFGITTFRDDAGTSCAETNAHIIASANLAYQAKFHITVTLTGAQLAADGYLETLPGSC